METKHPFVMHIFLFFFLLFRHLMLLFYLIMSTVYRVAVVSSAHRRGGPLYLCTCGRCRCVCVVVCDAYNEIAGATSTGSTKHSL